MTAPVLEAFGAAYLRLSALLDAAAAPQWQVAQSVRPREDTSERSVGVTSDPTWRAASDERRLRLRAAVVAAERARALAARQLRAAELNVADALTALTNDGTGPPGPTE
ncbi:hypothetical protein [uncultured Microbacterium sp.]|uniref:DUF7169 domain-containing protein n=1 Tax=uncultured Microbacterium sp. TaxID=191216 RepID=UPI0025F6DD0D|nr:hypothetical protein [uncultured Microbacterium sp.]